MRFSIVILFTVLAITSTHAQDASPSDPSPNDADVHTAYCVPVLKWQIGMIRQMARSAANPAPLLHQWVEDARALLPQLQALLDRFEAYLVPRTMNLDTSLLVEASMRAESDIQQFDLQSDRCSAQCLGPDKGDVAGQRSCWDACVDHGVIERIDACRSPSWLPK
jgi:hypothetical protein